MITRFVHWNLSKNMFNFLYWYIMFWRSCIFAQIQKLIEFLRKNVAVMWILLRRERFKLWWTNVLYGGSLMSFKFLASNINPFSVYACEQWRTQSVFTKFKLATDVVQIWLMLLQTLKNSLEYIGHP